MNIRKQYSLREYGLPSVFSGTNILTINESNIWCINDQPTGVSTTTIAPMIGNELHFYENEYGMADNYTFQKNLTLLNQRINAIHKELTYWDLYKLTASVDNAEDLDAVFSGLSVGQSMVINCPTFTKGGIRYARGDVIVRTTESSEIKIDALSTGLFYPKAITKEEGNVFTITYSYFEGSPDERAPAAEIPISNPFDPVQNGVLPPSISFEGLTDVAGTIYGLIRELPDGTTGSDYTIGASFPVLFENGNVNNHYILPIIKCFDDNYEEISLDRSRVWLVPDDAEAPRNWTIHCDADNVGFILKFVQVK